jgi:L-iditol 2-dehydrogenase
MLQAVMTSPGIIKFNNIAVPEPGAGRVLIKIMRIGICGSDIHVYHGKHPYTSYPIVQGHEVSGEVAGLGEGVISLKIGDRVTIQPQVTCGKCYLCLNGKYHICDELKVMGFQTTGAASEYFVAGEAKVVKLPDSMGLDEGAMIEPLAVAVHALQKGGDIEEKNVLVLGAGPIGNLVAQAAKGMGAKSVMITDLSEYRLAIAGKCGIRYCVNTSSNDISDMILEKFGPRKADLIFECVGSNVTTGQALNCARKGTDIIIVGVFPDKTTIDLGLLQDRELRMIGTLMYQQSDYEKAIELVETRKVKLKPLITDHFAFRDYSKAYEYIEKQKDRVMKVIIDVSCK